MTHIRIGTCSWKFPSWEGLVYSATGDIDYLQEYAAQYDTVEVDQWFWSLFGPDNIGLPSPSDVAAYRAAVPDTFRFSVKAPNSITLTHSYSKKKGEPLVANPSFLSIDLFQQFLSRIDRLRDVLGPIMFEFEYLNREKMPSPRQFLDQFEAFAAQLPAGYAYGLEVRNPNLVNKALFDMLGRVGVTPVLIQGYWMPPAANVYRNWRDLIAQHRTIVVRLLGPDRTAIEKQTGKRWDRIVAPKDDELPAIVAMVKDMADQGIEVYVNINNHYEGCAPKTIEKIRALL